MVPRLIRWCEVKPVWSFSWTRSDHLIPEHSVEVASPEISDADILYQFGEVKRYNAVEFADYSTLSLRNHYVRIVTQYDAPGAVSQVHWNGIFSDEEILLDRNAESGDQRLKAFGFGYLLDREPISWSFVNDAGTKKRVEWCPKFNERHKRGRTIFGNRSAELGVDGVYLIDQERDSDPTKNRWTNRQIVDYLLEYFAPNGITFQLGGQADELDALEEVHDFEGKTLWEALNALISRKRGLGFYFDIPNTVGSTVTVRVFTITDTNITYGSKTLHANDRQQTFTIPSTHPDNKQVGTIPLRFTSTNEYDEVRIRGERMRVCCTFSFFDGTLEAGWNPALEIEYKAGALEGNEDNHDRYRAVDRYLDVYSRFRVPPAWDWMAGDGVGGTKRNAALTPEDDGTVDVHHQAAYWNGRKVFDRDLPLLVGLRYETTPITNENPDVVEEDFRPLLVAIYDGVTGDIHDRDCRWHLVDRLSESTGCIHSMHIHPNDKEMGFRLSCSPRHILANDHWDGAAATNVGPELDYKKLLCTASFQTDQRQQIILKNLPTTPHESRRTLTIDIAGAEYWYVVRNTVIDVDRKGRLVRIHPTNLVVRDDRTKLEGFAAFAKAWFGVQRQAVQIPLRKIERWVELGVMLTSIDGVWGYQPVRTVVTARRTNFFTNEVVIETGWDALDKIQPIWEEPGTDTLALEVRELQTLFSKLPIRLASPATTDCLQSSSSCSSDSSSSMSSSSSLSSESESEVSESSVSVEDESSGSSSGNCGYALYQCAPECHYYCPPDGLCWFLITYGPEPINACPPERCIDPLPPNPPLYCCSFEGQFYKSWCYPRP